MIELVPDLIEENRDLVARLQSLEEDVAKLSGELEQARPGG